MSRDRGRRFARGRGRVRSPLEPILDCLSEFLVSSNSTSTAVLIHQPTPHSQPQLVVAYNRDIIPLSTPTFNPQDCCGLLNNPITVDPGLLVYRAIMTSHKGNLCACGYIPDPNRQLPLIQSSPELLKDIENHILRYAHAVNTFAYCSTMLDVPSRQHLLAALSNPLHIGGKADAEQIAWSHLLQNGVSAAQLPYTGLPKPCCVLCGTIASYFKGGNTRGFIRGMNSNALYRTGKDSIPGPIMAALTPPQQKHIKSLVEQSHASNHQIDIYETEQPIQFSLHDRQIASEVMRQLGIQPSGMFINRLQNPGRRGFRGGRAMPSAPPPFPPLHAPSTGRHFSIARGGGRRLPSYQSIPPEPFFQSIRSSFPGQPSVSSSAASRSRISGRARTERLVPVSSSSTAPSLSSSSTVLSPSSSPPTQYVRGGANQRSGNPRGVRGRRGPGRFSTIFTTSPSAVVSPSPSPPRGVGRRFRDGLNGGRFR